MNKMFAFLFVVTALMFSGVASADQQKVVIQVSSNDPVTQRLALNNAVNVQNALGMDNVIVEVVAYGPGLSLLTNKSTQASRVSSLAMQDITFSACANTMKAVEKKTGKKPQLVEGVTVVPAGVIRIMELQQQGYSYIRP
jgi:uncharacterized protein